MNLFQKLAAAALVSVLILIFVGAIVRVTGAGLGCPDWPKCWGCLIPPWKVEQVDLERIDFEKFQRKAERLGRDPETVTREHILESFNPRHVWTEFGNRLCSLPVGLFALATFVASFGLKKNRKLLWWCSFLALILVGVNAVMGARVVYSGIKPGVLTAHMALAMLLIALQAFIVWRGADRAWSLGLKPSSESTTRVAVLLLLGLVVAEGIMGTQIRELTDELAKSHRDVVRGEWTNELESSTLYLIHRSFSWAIVAASILAWVLTKRGRTQTAGGVGKPAQVVMAIVLTQMLLGLVMSQIQVYPLVQVLHVGLAGLLLAAVVIWLCGIRSPDVT